MRYEQVGTTGLPAISLTALMRPKPTADRPFVTGLPTSGTPLTAYKALVEMHKASQLASSVVTFNMDRYVGLPKSIRAIIALCTVISTLR